MKNFRDELRLITNHTEWTIDEKFEAIDELHERYVAKKVKLFTIPDVVRQSEQSFCAVCGKKYKNPNKDSDTCYDCR